eukprot:767625-Hanusia_phi.AAC.4
MPSKNKKNHHKPAEEQPKDKATDQSAAPKSGTESFHLDDDKIRQVFNKYDKDGSGYLEFDEVMILATDLYAKFNPDAPPVTGEQREIVAKKLMERIDQKHGNDDGRLSFDEFVPWYATAAEKYWKMNHATPQEKAPEPKVEPKVMTPEVPKERVKLGAATPALPVPPPVVSSPSPSSSSAARSTTGPANGFNANSKQPMGDISKMEDGSVWAVQVLSEGKVKILVARRIGLKDAGAKTLADALKKNKGLEEIYLCQNDIGPAGAKALGEAIGAHGSLKEVYLGYNQILDEGAQSLAEAMTSCKTLKVIDVDYNGISGDTPQNVASINACCDYFNGGEKAKVNTSLSKIMC